jgi:soluble lytic murein transglycosylase-like protein
MKTIDRRQFLKLGSIWLIGYTVLPAEKSFADSKRTLVDKIIYAESRGNPNAYRKDTNAIGLMQIRPVVLKEWNNLNPSKQFESKDLFNPYINVDVGVWYLTRIKKHYLPHYKLEPHLENILTSWNVGPTKHGEQIGDARRNFDRLPQKTKNFIKEIKSL